MKEITLIIPFRNEKEQVYKTCESFNAHCDKALFNILCINDCSDDDYEYTDVLKFDNVTLVENPERLGVAGSRDKGVKRCDTKYVLLIDGHMRVFNDVIQPLLDKLREHPNNLLCCQSQIIRKNPKSESYEIEKHPKTKGVKLKTNQDLRFLEYEWNQLNHLDLGREVIPIQCCMGACYAISREYYLHLHGLNGLQQWGMDEQFLSAKVWMSGGKVLLLKNINIAHIYRQGTPVPYKSFTFIKILNKLIISYLLCYDNSLDEFNRIKALLSQDTIDIYNELLPALKKERTYLSLIMKHTFQEYLKLAQNGRL